MDVDLLTASLPELAAAVRSGSVSAVDVTQQCLDRIDDVNPVINAVVAIDAEGALAAAAEIDDAISAGQPVGPCAGVPMLVKDLHNAVGLPTTFGARSMVEFRPPFDDHTVAEMRRAGFVIVGKTNTPEIGTLPVTEPVLHGPTRSPRAPSRTAGGSSGGAAAAVASGMVPAAQGSDGGGSIRIPASCCGVVGLKPSRGRVSHAPLFGDQVLGLSTQGALGRTVQDVAGLLDVIQGYAVGDPYHLSPPQRPFADEVGRSTGSLSVGVLRTVPWADASPEVDTALSGAVDILSDLGHRVASLTAPLPPELITQFVTLWACSVAATPLPREQMERHNRDFAAQGDAISGPDLLQAHTSLQLAARAFVGACADHDVVLAPVLMDLPPRVGSLDGLSHEELLSHLPRLLGVTPVVNVSGQPAITLPLHRTSAGVPVGVQLIGRHADEALLIRLAAQVQSTHPWPTSISVTGSTDSA